MLRRVPLRTSSWGRVNKDVGTVRELVDWSQLGSNCGPESDTHDGESADRKYALLRKRQEVSDGRNPYSNAETLSLAALLGGEKRGRKVPVEKERERKKDFKLVSFLVA